MSTTKLKPSEWLEENYPDQHNGLVQSLINWFTDHTEEDLAEFIENYLGVDMEASGIDEHYHPE